MMLTSLTKLSCPVCGYEVHSEATVCSECGAALTRSFASPNKISMTTTQASALVAASLVVTAALVFLIIGYAHKKAQLEDLDSQLSAQTLGYQRHAIELLRWVSEVRNKPITAEAPALPARTLAGPPPRSFFDIPASQLPMSLLAWTTCCMSCGTLSIAIVLRHVRLPASPSASRLFGMSLWSCVLFAALAAVCSVLLVVRG